MKPWAFHKALVLLPSVPKDGNIHMLPLKYGTFYVQLHDVPGFCMTVVVVQAVGAALDEILCVDNRNGIDCVGRFLWLHIQFDVDLHLMGKTPVPFQEVRDRI